MKYEGDILTKTISNKTEEELEEEAKIKSQEKAAVSYCNFVNRARAQYVMFLGHRGDQEESGATGGSRATKEGGRREANGTGNADVDVR